MIEKSCETYWCNIYIAEPIEVAKQIIRKYCKEVGLCVTIQPADYIYTMGEESGYCVGLINYPRFPKDASFIFNTATKLGQLLLNETYQGSFTVQCPDKTVFYSIRECDKV